MTLLEIAGAVAAVLTSLGAGGAIGRWVTGRDRTKRAALEGETQVGVALVLRDQTIADRLLTRIGDLETRCDVLSDGVTKARREAEEARDGRSECERRTKDLEGEVAELREIVKELQDYRARQREERDADVTARVQLAVEEAVRHTAPPGRAAR